MLVRRDGPRTGRQWARRLRERQTDWNEPETLDCLLYEHRDVHKHRQCAVDTAFNGLGMGMEMGMEMGIEMEMEEMGMETEMETETEMFTNIAEIFATHIRGHEVHPTTFPTCTIQSAAYNDNLLHLGLRFQ